MKTFEGDFFLKLPLKVRAQSNALLYGIFIHLCPCTLFPWVSISHRPCQAHSSPAPGCFHFFSLVGPSLCFIFTGSPCSSLFPASINLLCCSLMIHPRKAFVTLPMTMTRAHPRWRETMFLGKPAIFLQHTFMTKWWKVSFISVLCPNDQSYP